MPLQTIRKAEPLFPAARGPVTELFRQQPTSQPWQWVLGQWREVTVNLNFIPSPTFIHRWGHHKDIFCHKRTEHLPPTEYHSPERVQLNSNQAWRCSIWTLEPSALVCRPAGLHSAPLCKLLNGPVPHFLFYEIGLVPILDVRTELGHLCNVFRRVLGI